MASMRDFVRCVECGDYTQDAWIDGYEDDGQPIYLCDKCYETAHPEADYMPDDDEGQENLD